MAFLLCTNVVAVHALARCSPAAEGVIPCGHELPRCFVHRQLTADSAGIDELERFWALTREITARKLAGFSAFLAQNLRDYASLSTRE